MTTKTIRGFASLTLSILLVGFLAGAGSAAAHQISTSDLLLPYFEVDLSGAGPTTLFSVVNSSFQPVTIDVTVHSNWGIEILRAAVEIDGDAVKMIDLKKWLVDGQLPGRTLDAAELEHVQAALSGRRSPQDDRYYSSEVVFNFATGYVKIHLQGGHGQRDRLFGEYFVVDASQDFAEGDFLVPIDPQAACPGLCQRHGVRFLSGGGFDGGTEIVIWSQRRGQASESPDYLDAQMVQADALAYRENGDQIAQLGLGFLPLQVIKVSELGLSSPFGWIDLFTEDDVLITLRLSASHRYSVGFQTFCLPPRPPTGSITLIKHVINDEGGTLTPADFRLFLDNRRVMTGVPAVLGAGTYTAREENLPGYVAGEWSGDCAPDGTVTLAEGEHKVCEITNDDTQGATLTLIKHVDNSDGGTAVVADFPLFISGQQVASGVAKELPPGSYSASEISTTDYNPGEWGGDCDPDGNVTLFAGEHKVCEITNKYKGVGEIKTYLTLVKQVINDDGGTLGPDDFPLFISGQQVTTGQRNEVDPGSYTASEQNRPGYTAGSWGGDCDADGHVALVAGDDKTCVIVNNDDQPRHTYLTLVKQVINDDGGTLGVSDFPLFIDGQQVTSGVANDVDPGSYTASEQNQPGYVAGTWGGDCDADGHVTLEAGDSKTCVIVNDDETPPPTYLTLVKQVINDDGGTLGVSDFPLFIDGQQVTSGVANDVDPGSYTASEQNQPGYVAGTWGGDCDADGHVTLEAGDSKTCVIVNDDETPPPTYLTLVKQVINDDGGTLGVSDFPLFIDGQQVASGVANEVDPGSYTASEQNQPGYTAGTWGGDCDAAGHVTLEAGDNKTCVIVNDDEEPQLDDGCTPGYWKNHTDSWPPTGYSPGQSVASVFGAAAAYPAEASASLLEALDFGGGSGAEGAARNLLRAATAALLNASHPDVDYPGIAGSIISATDAALASGDRNAMLSLATSLDLDNNLGCPLN